MVFCKVRETYDLHTLRNKVSAIAIHTPGPNLIKRNYPGLLMQCKAYRPVSCDVKMACASMLPLDPQGIGTTEGDVAPEDVFNPILYKAVSNFSMSQIEEYLTATATVNASMTARGDTLDATNNGIASDDFALYYGLLSQTHDWKHANPQSGMHMASLRPLVYEMNYSFHAMEVKNNHINDGEVDNFQRAQTPTGMITYSPQAFMGKSKSMPWLPTTSEYLTSSANTISAPGFPDMPANAKVGVPAPKIYCGVIIVPPSRLHQLFYRLVVEWTLEFSALRPLGEITDFLGLQAIGNATHYMDYDFGSSKLLTESTDTVDTSPDTGISKVM